MPEAKLHDGSVITIEVDGAGPTLLLPVNPTPVEGEQAGQMRQYGVDPALGRALIDGLRDICRVVAFDYEGQVMRTPKPATLTPENVARDFLAVADAAEAGRFAWYGYSWLAMAGLQLALRTDRLTALVMGGFPPLDGPYAEMLLVTAASHAQATGAQPIDPDDEWSGGTLSPGQTQQFVTLYEALRDFDDRAAQARLSCSRLCFAGSVDEIQYGKQWGDTLVSLVGPLLRKRATLEALGWDVRVLDGLDHIKAMQAPNVLPVIHPWLAEHLRGTA